MSTQYGIGDFIIPGRTQESGIWLLKGTEYAPALTPRRAVVEIPQVHYAVPLWGDPMSQITVGLTVRVQGTDEQNLRSWWNKLISVMELGSATPIRLSRHRGTTIEYADAQLLSSTSPDFFCSSNRLDAQFVFNIPGGAWRSDGLILQDLPANTSDVASTVANLSTMPITDVEIRVPGPVGVVEVRDGITSTGVHWDNGSLAVPVGQYLYILPELMVAEISPDAFGWAPGNGTPASGRLVYTDNGPLVLKSRGLTASVTPYSSMSTVSTLTAGPIRISARSAVI